MDFSVLVLGSGASLPTKLRKCSAQLVRINNDFLLVDCGESVQLSLREHKISFQRINHIFISHLHGDHFLGLPGLLFSMHLLGRTTPLKIYAPARLKEIIRLLLDVAGSEFIYPIEYIDLQENISEVICEEKDFFVKAFPLVHKIPTWGFRFGEMPKARKIIKSQISSLGLTFDQLHDLKNGKDIEINGKTIANETLTQAGERSRSYAYCSDTAYTETILPDIQGVDLLYHEATFTAEKAALATEKYHSTTAQAAEIALKAQAKQLLLGHFSARYEETDELQAEACRIFPNTLIANDGEKYSIPV